MLIFTLRFILYILQWDKRPFKLFLSNKCVIGSETVSLINLFCNMCENGDAICNDSLTKRHIRPQNIVCHLRNREHGLFTRSAHSHTVRNFYQCIYPNLSIINVEKPAGFLRKFSPDGRFLIAFTVDQTALEIYEFNGVGAAAQLLSAWKTEVVPNTNTDLPYAIRNQIFEKLFTLKHTVNVASAGKQLNRECSLFTNDGNFVIVGAASFIPDEQRPPFYDLYTSNDSITPTLRSPLEDYSLFMIDLHNGCVTSSINYKNDKIFLSHNQGIYLYNNVFAVLSVQHQTIYLYEVVNGTLHQILKVGRFCNQDDIDLYNAVYETQVPVREATIGSLKHRFLVYLYRKAMKETEQINNNFPLRRFYQFFDQYKQLRIWKMQLLDENLMLIKYASEAVVTLKAPEPNSQPAFFVFYNIWDCEILAVYDNTSEDLLYLFENFSDSFRNTWMHSQAQFSSSPNNNLYAKLQQNRFKQTIVSARGGGKAEATKRLLAQLPISAQSYSNSPYLDSSIFSYDDKWVSMLERPKASGEYPIRFFGRDSGLLKFRIYPGLQDRRTQPGRRLVAFTFHPFEPFAISVQRIDNDYVVNFHIRNSETEIFK